MSYKTNVKKSQNLDYGGCIGVDCGVDFYQYIKKAEYYIVYAPGTGRIMPTGNIRVCSGDNAILGIFFRLYPYTKIHMVDVSIDGRVLKCKETGEKYTYYSYILALSMLEFAEVNTYIENRDKQGLMKTLDNFIRVLK